MIGALSGLLIGPTTTVFYDSGFLIGLKGFVAAVIGGLSSYPGALVGALFVGVIESFGSFWASAFKEVIVFTADPAGAAGALAAPAMATRSTDAVAAPTGPDRPGARSRWLAVLPLPDFWITQLNTSACTA